MCCYLPYLNIVNDITGTVHLAAAGRGCGGRQCGDDGAVPEVGVLRVHVLHAQPGGLRQLVPPAPQVTLASEVECLVLVVSPPADELRHVSQPNGCGSAGGDAAEALVGRGGGAGAGRGVRGRPGVLQSGQALLAGISHSLAAGQNSQMVVDNLLADTSQAGVGGRHEVMQLAGRRSHPLTKSQSLHVRELDLAAHLERLQVKVPDVEALVGLHHGVRDQTVQAGAVHIRIQF